MDDHAILQALRSEMREELTQRLLPYWIEQAGDDRRGGFVGLVTGDGVRCEDAPRGSILNARILWTFSAAYRALGEAAYAAAAESAAGWFRAHFLDPLHGGVYWMVDAAGRPCDDRKHVYAQAFAIYGLSEHFRATGDGASLEEAVGIFRLLEAHAFDGVHGGYQEAFTRDWVLLENVRLSEVDADERKSMNTQLHVLEAFTNLYRAWPDPLLRERLQGLVEIFLDRIVDGETGHVRAFFDEDWAPKSEGASFGHDIEASWLLAEAAEALGDPPLVARVRDVAVRMATAVLEEALDPAGGIFYEVGPDGSLDTDKEWWPQAEAIVGFLHAYQETGRVAFLEAARATWEFTRRHLVDMAGGEWYRRVTRDGTLRPGYEKVGPWKCPYHNGRACLEVMRRVERLAPPVAA